jgi:uncharacterized membrane protein
MNKVNWTVVAIVSIITLLVLVFGASVLGGSSYGGWGMMGPGMMGRWGFSPFGWIGMIFMWLIPAGFLVLVVLGIAGLVQNIGRNNPASASHACPSCGRGVQTDWKNCPYCGTALAN